MNLWQVSEETFDTQIKTIRSQETVFTIGNGYFCTRGTFEEGYPRATPATLLYGVFDKVPIAEEELANIPDWTVIKLFVNGERFRLDRGTLLDYHRTLDLSNGVLSRTVHWESPLGTRIRITTERFASLADEHIGIIRYSITAADDSSRKPIDISLRSSLDAAQGNYDLMHWESVDQGHTDQLIWFHSETKKTGVQLAQTMSFTSSTPGFSKEITDSDLAPSIHLSGTFTSGETLIAEKISVMYTSRDGVEDPVRTALNHHTSLLAAASNATTWNRSAEVGSILLYAHLLADNQAVWQDYWKMADIILEGDEKAQLALRYSLYQLRINVSSHDDRYSIAPKGLTGFGYRGHIFHDTEIFMLPFFAYVLPDIACNLLMYRYHCLPAARKKAASYGYEGAQYPWESTLSGEETTPTSIIHQETGEVIPVLNGSHELHITASIAHAVWAYWQVTGNDQFMRNYGAEIMLSTAMFWVSRAENHKDYEITDVIEPDEWHSNVSNDTYTNYMAKRNIQTALQILGWLKAIDPAKASALTTQLELNDQRLAHWQDVQKHLHISQDKKTGLFEQFEGFFKLATLDQEKYKGRKDSYQNILGIYEVQKYQIIKQADVLMLLTVLDQEFDHQVKRVNWDYYYPITDHDYGSSLTPALHVILASELGYTGVAYTLFMKGALIDLENLRGNTPEGIHAASAGAVWQAAILGFAGLRVNEHGYTTNPTWPNGWTRLAFHFMHRGKLVYVDLCR